MVWYSTCGLCNVSYYGECVRHLVVRSGEHIGISPLTNKRVQPKKDNTACHHLLNCNYSTVFEDFSVMCHEIKSTFKNWKKTLL